MMRKKIRLVDRVAKSMWYISREKEPMKVHFLITLGKDIKLAKKVVIRKIDIRHSRKV